MPQGEEYVYNPVCYIIIAKLAGEKGEVLLGDVFLELCPVPEIGGSNSPHIILQHLGSNRKHW